MGHKKEYEEKQRHGTVELPLGLHKMVSLSIRISCILPKQ